jgi:hypothetical protein
MPKRKPYATLDDIPRYLLDEVEQLARDKQLVTADQKLRSLLLKVQDLKDFEAHHLTIKIAERSKLPPRPVYVVGFTSAGHAYDYSSGRRVPGFGLIRLSNDRELRVPEEKNYFRAMLDYADEHGYDTTEMRQRLDEWVKTGKFPPPAERENDNGKGRVTTTQVVGG